jgi:hypothetical protein
MDNLPIIKKNSYTEAQKRAIYKYREKKRVEQGSTYNDNVKNQVYKWREVNKEKYNEACRDQYQKTKLNPELMEKRREYSRLYRKKKLEEVN